MMKQNKVKWAMLLVAIPLALWLLTKGLENKRDALWDSLNQRLSKEYLTLDKAADSLQLLFTNFHGVLPADVDTSAIKRISEPYLPTMEFEKFRQYFNTITQNKKTVVAGVSGSGNTTLADRIANLIATRPDNKLLVQCAPLFDLEMNKQYIGYFDNNTFNKGILLKFWEKCRRTPAEKFVCIFDNFDKINPETLFGPVLWEKMSDDKAVAVFQKDTVVIPANFYMISVTHLGAGQKVEMNDEQYKRLGRQIALPVNANELILYLRDKKLETQNALKKWQNTPPQLETDKKAFSKLQEQWAALNDTSALKQMIYFFTKINELIERKFASGYQLGQWSDLRKLYKKEDFPNFESVFKNHILSFKNIGDLKQEDIEPILYTIKTNGEVQNSSIIMSWASTLADLGFASELGVAGTFALISGLVGWLYFSRRKRHINDFTQRIYDVIEQFNTRSTNYDNISAQLNQVKKDFDALVLANKINYDEAAFFYGFLEDKTRSIEIAREINESFLKLVDAFLDDKILTDSEYQKLNQFLEAIRYKISTPQYQFYKNEIERIYAQFGNQLLK